MGSMWGNLTVDLTLDSDSDTDGTLASIVAHPPTRVQLQKTSIPSPDNVQQLYLPAESKPHTVVPVLGIRNYNRAAPSESSGKPVSHRNAHSVQSLPGSTNGQRNENGYVPVPGSVQKEADDGYPNLQPEKRRKLSVPEPQISMSTRSETGSGASLNRQRNLHLERAEIKRSKHSTPRLNEQKATFRPSPSTSGSSAGMKLAANGLPSVQSLNAALKSNGSNTLFPGAQPAASPHKIQFGRIDTLDGARFLDIDSRTGPISTTRAIKLNTSTQVDEMVVDQDDGTFIRDFVFRTSPLKKGPISSATYTQPHKRPSPDSADQNISPPRPRPITIQASPSGPTLSPREGDGDCMTSYSEPHLATEPLLVPQAPTGKLTPHNATTSVASPVDRKKFAGTFSEEESHLLIFLKEVKKLAWKDVTQQFQAHFPGRKYHTLQTHYSTKINRRDRSRDPATLNLPPRYASEAVIDWATVHEANFRPWASREVTDLQQQVHEKQRSDPIWPRSAVHDTAQEHSSCAESAPRRERPKRAVPPKDYTWPKRYIRRQAGDNMEVAPEYLETIEIDMLSGSEEPAERLQSIPEKAIPVENEPLSIGFEQEDAALALSGERLPYLACSQRSLVQNAPDSYEWDQLCSRDWHGSIIHVDFRPSELEVAERTLVRLLAANQKSRHHSRRKRLQSSLQGLSDSKLLHLSYEIHRHLLSRDRHSVEAFLEDARIGKTRVHTPHIKRLAAARPNRHHSTDYKTSVLSVVRQRELGLQSRRGWGSATRQVTYQLKNKLQDSLGPAFSYTGAASDVHAAAWSTDGQCFAAGAICVDDPDSMQYNRSNNLLFGDVSQRAIYELGEHSVKRERTESGPNSTHAMFTSQDPKLYKTVSSVAFSPNGTFMFSGGYDNHVCVWGTKKNGAQPELLAAMKHKAEIDMLAVNRSGLLATASKKGDNRAIKVIAIPEDNPTQFQKRNLGSERAAHRPDYKILPTALQFSPRHENLLLAGFGANARNDGRDMNGDICLWDVNAPEEREQLHVHGSGKNVFDLAFHSRHPWFAVGCVAGQNVNRGTRSIIRLYDENGVDNNNSMKYSMRMELECKALDMNDVVWW
jgi:WD40 repeat protein